MNKYEKACAYYNYCSEWIDCGDGVTEFEVLTPLLGCEAIGVVINTDLGSLRLHDEEVDYGAARYDEEPNKYTDNA